VTLVILRLLALSVVALVGAWLTRHVWLAIRSGTADMRGGRRVRRRTQPWYYWTLVVVQAGFAVMCFIAAARGVLR
jgi:hypothetical protein